MATYPSDYRYSEDHEWIRIEADLAVLGITHFAQDELGEVVFVELPEEGTSYSQHDEIGTIESVKAVAEVYTPVAGEIAAVNSDLEDNPELINEDPHGKGWMVKIKMSNPEQIEELMDAAAYATFVEEQEG
jgi:glycine cleavage system H protein